MCLAAGIAPLADANEATTVDYTCPGVPDGVTTYAWVKQTVTASASCDVVKAEMEARVSGQSQAVWTDPAMNGTYKLLDKTADSVTLSRQSKVYTDKLVFTFTSKGAGCELKGCSQSQVTSLNDFSTNYCNMYNMYCGLSDNCCPVKSDFSVSPGAIEKSMAAATNERVCSGETGGGGSGMFGVERPVVTCTFTAKGSDGNPASQLNTGASGSITVSTTTTASASSAPITGSSSGSVASVATSASYSLGLACLLCLYCLHVLIVEM